MGQLPGFQKTAQLLCKSKVIIVNQMRAYSLSLTLPLHSAFHTWCWPGRRTNEHIRAFVCGAKKFCHTQPHGDPITAPTTPRSQSPGR